MLTYDISKECEIAVSTSQNTASAHKAWHTWSHNSINSNLEMQKALRNLLNNHIKREAICGWHSIDFEVQLVKTVIKRQNGTTKLKQAMLLSDNCQLRIGRIAQFSHDCHIHYFPSSILYMSDWLWARWHWKYF